VNSTNGGQGSTAAATLTANGVGLSLLKSTSTSYYTAIGNTIVYNYLLTNTGTAVLYAPFTVSDNKITGTIDCGNGGTVTSLAPAATTTCSANYTVVSGDITTKSVTNTATATAKDAETGGGDVSSNSSSVTVPLSRLTLDKTTATTGYRAVGDRIDYTYTLTNTGNTTLYAPFNISDDHFSPFTCGSATVLPPSAVTSCSKTGTSRYTVTAGDVTAGSVVNIATATANDGSTGTINSNSDSVTVYAIIGPVISKSFSPNPVAVGGTSLLTITITNPNSVSSLTGVAFTDTFPVGMTKVSDPSGAQCGGTVTSTANSITLANGFIIPSGSCTVTILVSADVPKQYPNVSGTVSSTNGGNGNTASATLTVLDAPTISKSFTPDAIIENETSTLTITISNPTGNTGTLTGVGFTDSFPTGLKVKDPPNIVFSAGCGSPTFSPVANDVSLTFSGGTIASGGTCVVSVDVTAPFGVYNNNTQAVTSTNGGTGVPSNVATLTVSEAVDLSITKTDGKVAKNKGQAVIYTIEVLNAGPSAANGATVYDTFPSSLISPTWTCVADTGATCAASGSGNILDVVNLPAGKKVTYTVTTSIAANATTDVKNTASVVPPSGLVDLNEANNSSVDVNGLNGLTIEKTIDEEEDFIFDVLGQLVHYAYKATNTGTSTLVAPFLVIDDNVDAENGEVVCDSVPPTLAPAAFFNCSATHTVTQADLDSNFITNNVTATAKDGDGDTVTSNTATKTVSAYQGPLIGIAKDVTKVEKVSAGTHDVTMDILIKNYGNVTLNNVLVTDDLTDTFPLPTTFEVQSITSTDTTLILNNNPDGTPIFTGSSNINLLGPGNSLEVGQSKSFTLVVRVIPTSYGPYSNSAIAYGTSPKNVTVNDLSQAGVDPDPDHDNDPRNNNAKTSASFTGRIFDPPFGIKTLNANLQPYLQWTMVWINDTNIVGVNAVVHDPIPVFTEYVPGLIDSGYGVPSGAPAGSTSLGVSCTATEGSTATTTTLCYYEGPTDTYPRGQIIWQGILGPDLGVVDPKDARNAISITFGVRVNDSLVVSNNAFIDSDLNGDGDVDDAGERSVALASFVWDITPANLPATGFAPNQVSLLPKQASLYNGLGNIWLEVPKLGLKMPIVGVPMEENIWDVSWLGDKAGWLDETAYPTSSGNSVITGHVYLPNGKPGPFIDLKKLSWNDIITIHVGDKQFNYRVRQAKLVKPDDLTVLKSESSSWITLVTCQGYDEESDSYLYRQVVRAVLVDTK
jgi:LPXTG-site transpeptidase (sortase) family protein